MSAVIDKQFFVGLEQSVWLYSGAESPVLKGSIAAMHRYFEHRSLGPEGRERNAQVDAECKRLLAQWLGCGSEQLAFMSNSSETISMIASMLDLQPGDNIVATELEFPSGVLPWLALRQRGIEVRIVPHRQWQVTPEHIMEQLDTRTRLVMISHVSYLSGARFDYRQLYGQLQATNALLLLDATQSLGVLPVDAAYTDFLVCSSYKWLLSPHGLSILAVNPARTQQLRPQYIGWRSVSDLFAADRFQRYTLHEDARKFELGFPSYPAIYCLEHALRLLGSLPDGQLEQHILRLGTMLIESLQQLGWTVMTPSAAEQRAGNIAFACPQGEAVAASLQEKGIFVWGGDGRVRASIHGFNDETDIAELIRQLGACSSSTH